MLEVIKAFADVVVLVNAQVNLVKANKTECASLAKNVQAVYDLIPARHEEQVILSSMAGFDKAMTECVAAANEALAFVQTFQDKKFFSKFGNANNDSIKFTRMDKRISDSKSQLTTVLVLFTAAQTAQARIRQEQIAQQNDQAQRAIYMQQQQLAAQQLAHQQRLAAQQQAQQQHMIQQLAVLSQPKPVAAPAVSTASNSNIITTVIKNYQGMSHFDAVLASCILSNGLVVSGSGDKSIKLWNPDKGYCVDTLRLIHGNEVLGITEIYKNGLPTGYAASVSADEKIKIWPIEIDIETQTRKVVKTFRGHAGGVTCVADFGNGKIATGSRDKTVRIWDIDANEEDAEIIKLKGHTDEVIALVAMSEDMLVSASEDCTVKVWNIDWADNSAELIYTLEGHTEPLTATCKVSETVFATADIDGVIKLWNLKSGSQLATLKDDDHSVRCLLSMGPDSNKIVSAGGDGMIKVFDVSGNAIKKIKVVSHSYSKTVFTLGKGTSSKLLISGGEDLKLKQFNIETGAELMTFTGTRADYIAQTTGFTSTSSQASASTQNVCMMTPKATAIQAGTKRTSPPPANNSESASPQAKGLLGTASIKTAVL